MREADIRLGVLISGSGSTAEAIGQKYKSGELEGVMPAVVISSRPKEKAAGVEKAEALGIPTVVLERGRFASREEFGLALLQVLDNYGVDFVSQNGWLPFTPDNVIEKYRGRIFNQHPAPLDPGRDMDFGGEGGMYGAAAVCARLAFEWVRDHYRPWTEATVHHVVEGIDKGGLIRVVTVNMPAYERPVRWAELIPQDSGLTELQRDLVERTKVAQERLLPVEHTNVINVLQVLGRTGALPTYRREKPLISPLHENLWTKSKAIGVTLFPKG